MNPPSSDADPTKTAHYPNTPVEIEFFVKPRAGTWIVENNAGERVGGSTQKDEAVEQALGLAQDHGAKVVRVLKEDGSREISLHC